MGLPITAALFPKKLTVALCIAVALILVLSALNLFNSGSRGIPSSTVADIKQAAQQFDQAAKVIQESTKVMGDLNRTLTVQLAARQIQDDSGYDEALKRWGVPTGDASAIIRDLGLYEKSDYFGSGSLPTSKGGASSDTGGKDANSVGKNATDGGDPGITRPPSGNATEQVKQSYNLPDAERLHRQTTFHPGKGELLYRDTGYSDQHDPGTRQQGRYAVRGQENYRPAYQHGQYAYRQPVPS